MTKNNNVSAAHNNNSNGVAGDQLRAFIERIERMEEEKAAIVSDIKEIKAEARGNGFDVSIINKLLKIRKQDASERMEQEAVLDLYMGALGMIPQPDEDDEPVYRAPVPTKGSDDEFDAWAAQMADRIDPALLLQLIEGSKTPAGRQIIMGAIETVKAGGKVAALRADPSMAIVSAADLESSSVSTTQNASVPAALSAEAGEVVTTTEINEPQPADTETLGTAARDLTVPQALTGQVATHTLETANEAPMAVDGDSEEVATAPLSESVDILPGGSPAETLDGADQLPAAHIPDAGKSVEAPASAAPSPLYAAPGVVTWENAPPEGVRRHDFSQAFGDFGQDIAVIEDDLSGAAAQPIVKMGNVILDGWARYMKARAMIGPDGRSIEYPVVQYDGTDPLMDCIRWNLAGRIMADLHKRTVAQRLARINPGRRDEIYAAMELGMELVA